MDEERLGRFVDRIYEAAFGEDRWTGLIEDLCAELGATSATAMAWRRTDKFPFLIRQSHLPEDFAAQVEAYYHKVDPWLAATLKNHASGVLFSEALVPRKEFLETEMYTDFCRTLGIAKAVFAITDNTAEMMSSFNFYRDIRVKDFENDDIRPLQMLEPHLRRGLRLYHRLTPLRARAGMFEETFNALGLALFLLDDAGRLLEANRAGQDLLRTGHVLTVRNGRLTANHAANATALAAAISRLRPNGTMSPAASTPDDLSLVGPTPEDELRLSVTPLSGDSIPDWMDFERRSRLTFLVTAQLASVRVAAPIPPVLIERYGLTPAEADVACLLASGNTVANIAARRNTAVGTVHNQLKQIYLKTDTAGQTELVVALLRLSSQ